MKNIFRSAHLSKTPRELLAAPVTALVGVTDAAAAALTRLGVVTVLDLAASRVFDNAYQLSRRSSPFSWVGRVPSDAVRVGHESDTPAHLAEQSIEVLDGIGPNLTPLFMAELAVSTIRELAAWPPYRAARTYVRREIDAKERFVDEDIPDELVPKFNEYPTEKVFYSVYTIDDSAADASLDELSGALDITKSGEPKEVPRTGYVLRFEQSWNAVGVALGNLLHSLALAPGESTRVAVVDWTRRQGVRTEEAVSQIEELSNSMVQARSINEVTRAVAREAQSGFSNVHSNATVSNNAYATYGIKNPQEALAAAAGGAAVGGAAGAAAGGVAGVGIGAVVGGVAAWEVGVLPGVVVGAIAGGAIGVGAGGIIGAGAGGVGAGLAAAQFGADSANSSNTVTDAVSTSSSSGERDLAASMMQNVLDRTQQFSSSSRNKRASIVQEVSQSESERITTRVVTNYNHMHALTIQYFEVVQLYAVKVRAVAATRCLYVPIAPIRWTDELIDRFRTVLARAALRYDVLLGLLVTRESTVMLAPSAASLPTAAAADYAAQYGTSFQKFRAALRLPDTASPFGPLILPTDLRFIRFPSALGVRIELRNGETIYLGGADAGPKDIRIGAIASIGIYFPDSLYQAMTEDAPGPAIQHFTIVFRSDAVECEFVVPCDLKSAVPQAPSGRLLEVLRCSNIANNHAVLDHLNHNTVHYTMKVVQQFSELEFTSVLAGFRWGGDQPVLNQIDPTPMAVSGMNVVFRLKDANAAATEQWKQDNGYDEVKTEVVPLGTSGVFAEAVLGRANSAEKLDPTRFWNWQDSPIPITASEIAPISAGSRATNADVRPGGFDPALVNTQPLRSMPDPQGTAAILNTLGASNLFRDMSGIVQSAQLAQASLEQAMKGSTATGALASEDLRKGLDLTKEIGTKILQMTGDFGTLLATTGFGALTGAAGLPMRSGAASTVGGGAASTAGSTEQARASPNLGNSNPSVAGAMLNHGRRMDERERNATPVFEALQPIGIDPVEEIFEAPVPVALPAPVGGGNEREAFDNLVGTPRRRAAAVPVAPAFPTVQLLVNFKHELSGAELDGEFTIVFLGDGAWADRITVTTVNGSVWETVPLPADRSYAVHIEGERTRRPQSPDAIAQIPSIRGSPAFTLDVSRQVAVQNVSLRGNGFVTLARGQRDLRLTVTAKELSGSVKVNATTTDSTSWTQDLALEFEPTFMQSKAGKIVVRGVHETTDSDEVGIEMDVDYHYLTGALEVLQFV